MDTLLGILTIVLTANLLIWAEEVHDPNEPDNVGAIVQPYRTRISHTAPPFRLPPEMSCNSTHFKCASGQCVTTNWLCDGEEDCDDYSDEDPALCAMIPCNVTYVLRVECDNGVCVDQEDTCDGRDDCGDGSDERYPHCPLECDSTQFKCSNGERCVSRDSMCDGNDDCGDESDENHYSCRWGHPRFVIPASTLEPYGYASLITSVIVTEDKKIVMVDYARDHIRVLAGSTQTKALVSSDSWSMAFRRDGLVAVTREFSEPYYDYSWSFEPKVDFVNVSGAVPEVVSTIDTWNTYLGVCQGDGDTLIVSTEEEGARIEVIDLSGDVVREILNGSRSSMLMEPRYLTRWGGDVYVSDWGSHKVFRVGLETGRVDSTFAGLNLSDLDLWQPREVAFDDNGNMYVATGKAGAENQWQVLMIQRNGTARVFLDNGVLTGMAPYGLTVDSGAIIVSLAYRDHKGWKSELRAYDLPA